VSLSEWVSLSHNTGWTLYISQSSTDVHQTCRQGRFPGDVVTYCFGKNPKCFCPSSSSFYYKTWPQYQTETRSIKRISCVSVTLGRTDAILQNLEGLCVTPFWTQYQFTESLWHKLQIFLCGFKRLGYRVLLVLFFGHTECFLVYVFVCLDTSYIYRRSISSNDSNKMLSYRRQTALQGAL